MIPKVAGFSDQIVRTEKSLEPLLSALERAVRRQECAFCFNRKATASD
jgi:hypothetical protein